jgi:uncharacterized BrkB/YihY/UPF0761 family membrane protein
MHLFLLFAMVILADYVLITNTKATILIIIGTVVVSLLNYYFSILACEETVKTNLATLLRKLRWYLIEIATGGKIFAFAIVCIGAIWLIRYLPNNYTVNWRGLIGALIVLFVATFVSGFLGTKRGISKCLSGS